MDKETRTYFPCLFMLTMMLFLPLTYVSPTSSISMQDDSISLTSGRAQTTWSGVVELTESYTVNVTDELIINPCTVVKLANAARLFVDGRILVQGDSSCAVTLETINTGLHYGIQFNQSSYGRGSIIDNLSIVNSMYGVTIYGSNPVLNNVTVVNPSRVAVDLFSSANPIIRDLVVDQAGRGFSYADWRYGIGLSVGAGSAPVVERAVLSDMRIRGLNIWGDSGGIFSGVTIDNVTAEGALAISAGVWVEDSRPLITNVSVDKSDYGMLIRHIDDGGYTRAVVMIA